MQPIANYRLSDTPIPQLLTTPVQSESAWIREDLSPEDWIVPLPEVCIAELDAAVEVLRRHPQPLERLAPTDFNLTACMQVMSQVQCKLRYQTGLAILDRIPVERYSVDENKAIYWLLANLLGRVVAQKWGGTYLYDVKDSGKALGHGVRRSITNLEQPFHTDGPWLGLTPEYVSLFCLQTAQNGGMSRLASLLTVHNAMQQHHPDLLPRLYQPFLWDRQAEHGPDDMPYSIHPVYHYDGQALRARYYDDYVRKGHRLADTALDSQGADALDAIQAIVNTPEHWVEFRIEAGQIQYINNRQFAHARTGFTDDPAVSSGRHMIRCWYRNEGAPHIEG